MKAALRKLALGLSLLACLASAQAQPSSPTPFHPAEAEALLAPGEASLTGRIYTVPSGRKALIEFFQKRKYGNNLMVYLLPATAHLKSVTQGVSDDQLFYAVLSKLDPQAEVWSARVMTDEEGNFRFRALKPGQYLLLATIPYKTEAYNREYQGEVTTTTYPNRVLITADRQVQLLPDGTSRMRVIEQFENHPQNVDFYLFTMDFDTKTKKLRTYKAYRIFKDGRLEFEDKPSNWMAVANNWMRVCYEISAKPDYFEEQKAMAPALGKMVRPVDVVELNRRILWEFKPPR